MSGTSRRLGKRSAQRNRLRRNSDGADQKANRKIAKKKPSQKTKELASNYKSRSSKFKRNAIDRIKTTIKKRYEALGDQRNSLNEFALRESDSQMVSEDITNVMTIQSDRLTAYRYVEDGRTKIIIEGITGVDDNGFGMIDSINAIVEDFGLKDLKKVDLFINTKNNEEQQLLEEYLSIDKDLIKKVSFIERRKAAEQTIDDLFDSDDATVSEVNIIRLAMEPAISSVMESEFLKLKMREVPKEKSIKYLNVIDKLDTYHKHLENFKNALYSETNPNYQGPPQTGNQTSDEILGILDNDLEKLKESIETYISDSRTLPHKHGDKKKKKDVMGSLLKQIDSLSRKRFNEATNKVETINTDIDEIRREVLINQYNPLTESDINKTAISEIIGEGAGGAVKAVTFTGNPPFYAAIKIDGASNDEAGKSGIPSTNPEQSMRAVSSFLMSELLDLDLVPETRLFVRSNLETGLTEVGHAMKFVEGEIGQVNGLYKNGEATPEEYRKLKEAEQIVLEGWPGSRSEEAKQRFREADGLLQQFTKIENRFYKDRAKEETKLGIQQASERLLKGAPIKPIFTTDQDILNYHEQLRQYNDDKKIVNEYNRGNDDEYRKIVGKPPSTISLNDGVVQKSLSDLQLFDNIIGHADRHGENYIFEKNSEGKIIGIKGIDNSDTFGAEWKTKDDPRHPSKTPGIPPVIDFRTAIKILSLNKPSKIEATLKDRLGKNLSETEIRATFDRLTSLQKNIVDSIVSGDITLATTGSGPTIIEIGELQSILNDFDNHMDDQKLLKSVKRWGAPGILDLHNEDNSYLGTSKALGEERGYQDPLFAL